VAKIVNHIHDKLSSDVEQQIMTLADRLKHDGLQQGLQQGKLEDAREMLLHKIEPSVIADITKLDIELVLAEAAKLEFERKH